MTTDLLRKILAEAGYVVSFRSDRWAECSAERESERWRGRGLDEDDALEDALRQMFPSSLSRELLERRPNGCAATDDPSPPAANGADEMAPATSPPAPCAGAPPAENGSTTAGAPAAARSLRVVAAVKTDRGLVRERNEDACLVLPERGLVAVADGLGTHPAGEIASAMVVETLRGAFEDVAPRAPVRAKALPMLVAALERANAAIFNAGRHDPARRGMATTVAVALSVGRSVVLAHVGDSRVYRLRRGVLGLLTNDHSAINESIRSGKPVGAERRAVTRALGARRAVEAETAVVTVQAGDVLLLSTAGLHRVVGNEELAAVLAQHAEPAAAVEELVARARAQGAPDDVTAAVIRWEG